MGRKNSTSTARTYSGSCPSKPPTNGQPLSQRLVNDVDLTADVGGLTIVSLPDSGAGGTQSPGTGNQAYLTEGASLVVVYRDDQDGKTPLKSVVIYDGGFTFNQQTPSPGFRQTVKGFYQSFNPPARPPEPPR